MSKLPIEQKDYLCASFPFEETLRRKVLLSIIDSYKNKNLLDIGCGGGRYVFQFVKEGATAIGIDISDEAIKFCSGRRNDDIFRSDMTTWEVGMNNPEWSEEYLVVKEDKHEIFRGLRRKPLLLNREGENFAYSRLHFKSYEDIRGLPLSLHGWKVHSFQDSELIDIKVGEDIQHNNEAAVILEWKRGKGIVIGIGSVYFPVADENLLHLLRNTINYLTNKKDDPVIGILVKNLQCVDTDNLFLYDFIKDLGMKVELIVPGTTDIGSYDLLWYHNPVTTSIETPFRHKGVIEKMKDYIINGGRLVLTAAAMFYASKKFLGLEDGRAFELRENTLFIRGNGQLLPFKGDTFDIVTCIETLEHIEDYKSVLREIHRVVKPNGTVIVSTPIRNPFSAEWFMSKIRGFYSNDLIYNHLRRFKQKDIIHEIAELGFRIEKIRYLDHYFASIAASLWLESNRELFRKYLDLYRIMNISASQWVWGHSLGIRPDITRVREVLKDVYPELYPEKYVADSLRYGVTMKGALRLIQSFRRFFAEFILMNEEYDMYKTYQLLMKLTMLDYIFTKLNLPFCNDLVLKCKKSKNVM